MHRNVQILLIGHFDFIQENGIILLKCVARKSIVVACALPGVQSKIVNKL